MRFQRLGSVRNNGRNDVRRFAIALAAIFLMCISMMPPAQASIHVYPETDTTTMYRSRQTLQDDQGQAWQAILFKRIQSGQVIAFNLRLVGFPGQVNVKHAADLRLAQVSRTWVASDNTLITPQLSQVSTSVGEYDVMPLMKELDLASRMEITLTLDRGGTRTLIVPKSMVMEWLTLKDQT